MALQRKFLGTGASVRAFPTLPAYRAWLRTAAVDLADQQLDAQTHAEEANERADEGAYQRYMERASEAAGAQAFCLLALKRLPKGG